MLESLFTYFGSTIYVKLSPKLVILRSLSKELRTEPVLWLKTDTRGQREFVSVGSTRPEPNARAVRPCATAGTLITDAWALGAILRYLMRQVLRSRISIRPRIVMHLLPPLDTAVCSKHAAHFEGLLLAGVGARRAVLWRGRELTEPELKAWNFRKSKDDEAIVLL